MAGMKEAKQGRWERLRFGKRQLTVEGIVPEGASPRVADTAKLPSQASSRFWQGLKDSPIPRKIGLAVSITGLLSVAALGTSLVIFDRSLRQQMLIQAQSELSLLAIRFNQEVSQTRFGDRGAAEERTLIDAARRRKGGLIVKSILQNEVSGRNVDFLILVDRNGRIVETSRSAERTGDRYDPQGLVSEAIDSSQTLISNELMPFAELEAENPDKAARIGTAASHPQLLAHYRIKPLIDTNRDVVGAVITADVINQRHATVDAANRAIGGGMAAIVVNGNDLATAGRYIGGDRVERLTEFPLEVARQAFVPVPESAIKEWRRKGSASYSPLATDALVRQEVVLAGRKYTVAAAPIVNHAGKPIGVLMRGTGHEALNALLTSTALLVGGVGAGLILIGAAIAQRIVRLVTVPIAELERAARGYAAGELSQRAVVDSRDELGTLADVFNQMADTLQQRSIEQAQAREQAEQQSLTLQEEIGHLLDVVSDLEGGDFTVQARVSDQATGLVADTLNRLIEELSDVLAKVLGTAQNVAESAESLETLAITVAQNAQQQVQSVNSAQVGMEDVTRLAQEAASQAAIAATALREAQLAVRQGQTQVENLTTSVARLQEGTDRMVQRITSLGEFLDLAKQFVQDQKRLASLTQVLAMNASMVAARALEQREPDQFASVAREFEAIASQVNGLASQTSQGLALLQQRTGFIEIVISGIDRDVSDVTELVKAFTTSVDRTSQSFQNIEAVTEQVAQIGQTVTLSSQQIAASVATSFESVRDIAAIADRSAMQARITRERSAQMGDVARRLLEDIRFFRLPADKQSAAPTRLSLADGGAIDIPAVPALSYSNGSGMTEAT